MEQSWFEMPEVRKHLLSKDVWVPLIASRVTNKHGEVGEVGYKEEYLGIGSVAVSVLFRDRFDDLGWTELGPGRGNVGYCEEGRYRPSYAFYRDGEIVGEHLVLDQAGNSDEKREWHLSQDFVITLGLKREGDTWVRIEEGYIDVARLSRNEEGEPVYLKVRAAHLKDYLCARSMALYVSSYQSRTAVLDDASHILWKDGSAEEITPSDHWEGDIRGIHEGGMPFGQGMSVLHLSRTDVDPEEDVPVPGVPTDDGVKSTRWTRDFEGRKLFNVRGELWRNQWIEPASSSPIVRGDDVPSTVYFAVDADGNKMSGDELVDKTRWLWFKPEVVPALLACRGGWLTWYTRDTGSVSCSPGGGVHFGLNKIGLVTVFAHDIGSLPGWKQLMWSGYNVGPEGAVSEELLDSQMKAQPAQTSAPEQYLKDALDDINRLTRALYGFSLFKEHKANEEILRAAHRFSACGKGGIYALAKDLARLTSDGLNVAEIQKVAPPPSGAKLGPLKSLENLLKKFTSPQRAEAVMSPLFGIYELRLVDAHLPSENLTESFLKVAVDPTMPKPIQGYQLLVALMSALSGIFMLLQGEKRKAE